MTDQQQGDDIVISVKGLKNSFGEQIVHEDLDLDVKRGEILGVVGGSGTGKSVLMRSIIGLQVPDADAHYAAINESHQTLTGSGGAE